MQLLFENAHFWTLDPQAPTTNAILVDNGRIKYGGTREDCLALASHAHRVDLQGAHVLPGFADAHVHAAQAALEEVEIDLSTATDTITALNLVLEHQTRSDNDTWILASRWNHRAWTDNNLPDRWQLDQVTGTRPAALHHRDLHTYWLNSRALELLDVESMAARLPEGMVLRDSAGELTGIVMEHAAFEVQVRLEQHTTDLVDKYLLPTLRRFARQGITTIHDFDGLDAWSGFKRLHEQGLLPLRVVKYFPVNRLEDCLCEGLHSGTGDDQLQVGGIKVFADGSLSSGTCLMSEPYGSVHSHGLAVTEPGELKLYIRRAHENGLAIAIHAIGDAAISNALDAISESRARTTRTLPPDRIEHAQHISPKDLARFAQLGVAAVMQPTMASTDAPMVMDLLGDRNVLSYAWRALIQQGATVVFSSDAPVEDPNPLRGIYAALTRRTPGKTFAWQPDQTLERHAALTAACSSHACLGSHHAGPATLRPTKPADFVLLDTDPFAATPDELLDASVLGTFIAGQAVSLR